ncbi:MAG: DNA repair protein RecO C-terminal domain-containing protein [Treponema sp.]|jgi:DNA repair protein RecO (recombination protein O)|nr:DNA repair protein RecO C-terminal domain-containing protein [Treponema sp.]
MSRTSVYSALILRSRLSGESNSELSILTAEEGVIRATVFGGPKSKMRSHSAPYNSGKAWIYRDPAKDYRKLSDFDVHSWRPGLRELYERTMAAGAASETILASHGGGGEWETALNLAISLLDTLETANEELCPRLLVHFLWQWSDFLGIQPQLNSCSVCEMDKTDIPLWFSPRENSLYCENCLAESSVPMGMLCPQERALSPRTSSVPKEMLCPQGNALSPKECSVPKEMLCPQRNALSPKKCSVPGMIRINPGCRRWLASTEQIAPSSLYRFSMDNKSFEEAKALATTVMTAAIGKRLASWDW